VIIHDLDFISIPLAPNEAASVRGADAGLVGLAAMNFDLPVLHYLL
jgi:hypothetical protein